MKRNTLIFSVALAIVVIAFVTYFLRDTTPKSIDQTQTSSESTTTVSTGRAMTVEQYVTENISALSPEKEVLGGKFYVTKIEAHGGAGTVSYEDGHNAYIADFTYDTAEDTGAILMKSFEIRK